MPTGIVAAVPLSGSYRSLLRNCNKVKKLERGGQAGWGVGGVLRPIHHWHMTCPHQVHCLWPAFA